VLSKIAYGFLAITILAMISVFVVDSSLFHGDLALDLSEYVVVWNQPHNVKSIPGVFLNNFFDGNWKHLLSNVFIVGIFGLTLITISPKFFITAIISGLTAPGALYWIFGDPATRALGASDVGTALMGAMITHLILDGCARGHRFFVLFCLAAAIALVVPDLLGYLFPTKGNDVNHLGHLLGFSVGFCLSLAYWWLNKSNSGQSYFWRHKGRF